MAHSQMEQLGFPIIADAGDLNKVLDEAVRRTGIAAGRIKDSLQGIANDNWGEKIGKDINAAFDDAHLKTAQAMSGELPKVGEGLGGLAKAAGLASVAMAALAFAYQRTRVVMQTANEIKDSAEQIGLGVEALQEWRAALAKAGGEAGEFDGAMQAFTKTLGLAINGGKEQLEWFGKLGIGPEQLLSFRSAEEALGAVADKISKLDTEADKQAFASKLGVEPLLPILRLGADGMDDLREAMRTAGVVMSEEVIDKAADAQGKVDALAKVVDTQLNVAFADLAPLIGAAAGALADFMVKAGKFLADFKRIDDAVKRGSAMRFGLASGLIEGMKEWQAIADGIERPSNPQEVLGQIFTPAKTPDADRLAELRKALEGRARQARSPSTPYIRGPKFTGDGNIDEAAFAEARDLLGLARGFDATVRDPLKLNGVMENAAAALDQALKGERESIQATVADGIEGGLRAGVEDGLPGILRYVAQQLGNSALKDLSGSLAKLATGNNAIGVSGFGSFVAGLFGGKRAGGGRGEPGMFYKINEGTPKSEYFFPDVPGVIAPHDAVQRALGQASASRAGMTVVQPMNFDLRGAVLTQDLLDQMNAIGAQAAQQGAVGGARLAMRGLPGAMAQQRKLGTIR